MRTLRRAFGIAGFCLTLGATLVATAAPTTPTTNDADEGFTPLFNGKDLTGWKLHPNPNPGSLTKINTVTGDDGKVIAYTGTTKAGKEVDLWRVKDGVLVGSGPATHLFSEKGDYTDLVLRVEAKINDKGNSGMYVRAKFAPGFPPGYETQINATGGDPIKTGSLYPDGRTKLTQFREKITVMNTAAHKPDEFFVQETKLVGSHFEIKVNGKTTVDFTDPNNLFKSGHVALQGHDPGTVVTFKRVEVKTLAK